MSWPGLNNRWVPFVAFMDMLTADMLAWFEGGKMPEDIAGTMRRLRETFFDPVAILLDLIERIRPTPDVDVERPNKIRLAWTELLIVPGSSSYARFFISLRLGLGRQFC